MRTYTAAMFAPTKTAPRVGAMFLDMVLRSKSRKWVRGKGGGLANLIRTKPRLGSQ